MRERAANGGGKRWLSDALLCRVLKDPASGPVVEVLLFERMDSRGRGVYSVAIAQLRNFPDGAARLKCREDSIGKTRCRNAG